jgi:hypothetical protein
VHRLLAVASPSVHVAASPTTAGAGFSAVNRFRPPLLATGLVVHLQFVAALTTVNRHFEPFGFMIVLHLLS